MKPEPKFKAGDRVSWGAGGSKEESCSQCAGTGLIHGNKCDTCEGEGAIIVDVFKPGYYHGEIVDLVPDMTATLDTDIYDLCYSVLCHDDTGRTQGWVDGRIYLIFESYLILDADPETENDI